MPRILSGVQPTGNTHLGNYVGAFRQWVDMQHDFEAFYPVVDLHAITLPYDPRELADRTLEVAAILLAAGLDPDVCTVFVQSHVPEHTELAWLFNHLATVGELRRMTQFKAKAEAGGEGALPAGYFNYPVLQAADILIYQADRVPGGGGPAPAPGADPRRGRAFQRPLRPHLRRPRGLHPRGRRPGHGPPGADGQDVQVERLAAGRIEVLDPPEAIRRKIRSAVTDSGREVLARPDKPAISNLLELFSVATGTKVGELEEAYAGRGYGDFKADLADALIAFLAPVRERYQELRGDPARLEAILEQGAAKAQAIARENLALAKDRMGFLPGSTAQAADHATVALGGPCGGARSPRLRGACAMDSRSMTRRRLGVIARLPEPLAIHVQAWRRALGDPAAERIEPHLTLVPPQTVAERDLDGAAALLERAAAEAVPFLVELDGAATFLPDSPVAYLVVREGGPALAHLDAVLQAPPLDRRTHPFHPHVTIAQDLPADRIEAAAA